MKHWKVFVLVISIFGFGSDCHQAPASTKHYEVGNVYSYDYVVKLEMNEPAGLSDDQAPPPGSTVGYKIITKVEVKPVWQSETGGSILEILLVKPHLQIKSARSPEPEGFRDHSSNLDHAKIHPFFIHWKDGQVQETFSVKSDDVSLVNVKKGIANILQISATDEKERTETTPAGKCFIKYDITDAFHLTKTIKKGSKCDTTGLDYAFRTNNNPVLGSELESEVFSKVTMSRDSGVVEDVQVSEMHVVRVTAKKEVGATIHGSQTFKLSDTSTSSNTFKGSSVDAVVKAIEKLTGLNLVRDSLSPKWEKSPYCESATCKTTSTLSQSLAPENMATTKMASAFLQMVSKFREAKAQEIQQLLKPKSSIFPQILDVCAAAGTFETHQAVMKTLNFHLEDDITLPERYLLGLALSPSPPPEVLQDLFKLTKRSVPSEKLQESLILTTAAIAHTISEKNRITRLPQSRLFLEIEEYLVNALSSCDGETASQCSQLYLRSLKNLKSKSTVPTLFDVLTTNDQKSAIVAMKSLHAMPDSYIDPKYRPLLIKIVLQLGKKYDSSVRTLALDLILRNHLTKLELREVVSFLLDKVSDKQHAEVATFMWNRVAEFAEMNPSLGIYFSEAIKELNLQTYHHLSPRGLSTAFNRYFTSTRSGNSSFSNAIEMSGKILKRSLFDVFVRSENNAVQLLSLGIFADGLASFASDDNEPLSPEEEEVDATAGMELTLMEVQTRPLVFFVGKGELMGLVWSGAGSERTSAIQGNVLLQDDKKVIPLFNGLVAEVNILGGLSFDLAGQVQISLWHRTANSLVENKAGLVLQSVVRADTSFVKSRVDYTIATEAALHFTSDINFYQGVIMCLKLTQPEFKIRQNIHKTERIPGSKHKLRKAKYKTIPVPGLTYALNKKNSELCGVMYKDKEEL
ncbi:microsomal triglyceride transfer protein large subunit isoform X2 [Folsomia candida]|uniref:microsomal triglyceride transfer protein large subunit isoform X2 n=1 Tax=Folsomia candida TaxID=158441 RepID=UPI0016052780|nr:microsomal triglyceride transfer protein large subunit isoform X2 [Folsomia candida]